MSRLQRELKHAFLETLAGQPSRPEAVWGLFASNAWFREELARMAERVLGEARAPLAWRDDIVHEALLLLARDLRNAPDLHADRRRLEHCFGGWLRSVMRRGCQQAVRQWQRRMGRLAPDDRHVFPSAEVNEPPDVRLDVTSCVERLNDDERWMVRHFSHGFTILEIASLCGRTPRQVRYALRRALRRMQFALQSSYGHDG